jgi:hypothetical protein
MTWNCIVIHFWVVGYQIMPRSYVPVSYLCASILDVVIHTLVVVTVFSR